MHPILCEIPRFTLFGHAFGPLPIYMYGVMLSLAFLFSIALTAWEARKAGITVDNILDLAIYVIILAIVMSRVGYIVTNWADYSGNAASMMKIYEGGLSFHGGVVGGVLAGLWFCKRRGISPWVLGDAVAPALALGLAIGRIGCFFNACCYGRPTHSHVGVVFPALHDGVPRHPTQLYDLAFNLAIMALLIGPLKRFKRKDGDLMAFWLILSGVTRFIMEHYRRGETAIIWHLGLTMGQWLCIALVLGGVFLYSLKRKNNTEAADAP